MGFKKPKITVCANRLDTDNDIVKNFWWAFDIGVPQQQQQRLGLVVRIFGM